MISALYAVATSAAAPLLRLMLRRRVARGKEIAARLPEREGIEAAPRPDAQLLWLHAASVGETVSVLPLLAALADAAPDLAVLMTTGTVTSAELLARRLPELGLAGRVTHRFVPLDVPAWVARFMDHWRPDVVVLVESEIWPSLFAACRNRRTPLALVNARLSPRSFARWRRLPGFARTLFSTLALVQAQSAADAERLHALGAPGGVVPGNLKFAAPPLPVPGPTLHALREAIAGRPVWLAASTHPGEDAMVMSAHTSLAERHAGLLTIIVPRHPQRGAEIAAIAGDVPVTRRACGQGPPAPGGVWVADTLGELGLFYAAAAIAFVGGSLVAHGGQNPLEPARLGCAVAVGPHTVNFAEPVAALAEARALDIVADAAALARWVDMMLSDDARRRAAGEAGRVAACRDADLPARVAGMLAGLLPRAPA